MPPPLNRFVGIMWLASLLAGIAVLARSPRRLSTRQALMLLAFLPLAAGSVLHGGDIPAGHLAAGAPAVVVKDLRG